MGEDKYGIVKEIPIMPQVATKILRLQENNLEISFKELEKVIILDPALTAKILKVANSALYARQKEITNLQQAITLLGFKTIKSLVLLVCASNIYERPGEEPENKPDVPQSKLSATSLWKHLVLTAFIARYLAEKLGEDEKKENIFIAGLLHDIGRIVFMRNDPVKYNTFLGEMSENKDADLIPLEERVFGLSHCEAGKIVFQKWNFPEEFIDAVSLHHTPDPVSPFRKTVEITGIANLYAKILKEESLSGSEQLLREKYSKSLAVTDEIEEYLLGSFIGDIENDELYIMSSEIAG